MMKVKRLQITSVALMLMSTLSLTTCGDKKHSNYEYKHEHLIVKMGEQTYIIRECDENISKVDTAICNGHVVYEVYDADGNFLLNANNYDNPQYYVIDSEEQEQEINAIEEKAIDNGAILYRGLTK